MVGHDRVDGLLAVPYDGGPEAGAIGSRPRRPSSRPTLCTAAMSDCAMRTGMIVLKFVRARLVLECPGLALYQRGQTRIICSLAEGFHISLNDPNDAGCSLRWLLDSVEAATKAYRHQRGLSPPSDSLRPSRTRCNVWASPGQRGRHRLIHRRADCLAQRSADRHRRQPVGGRPKAVEVLDSI